MPLSDSSYLISPVLCVKNLIITLTDAYFRRLKINHDMHEFILESGTVANRYGGVETGFRAAASAYSSTMAFVYVHV